MSVAVTRFARDLGPVELAKVVARRGLSSSTSFGLAADLGDLPGRPAARTEVFMEEIEPRAFRGFHGELDRVSRADLVQVVRRVRMVERAVETLYVASDPQGAPIYAQWLIAAGNQAALHRAVPGLFPHLEADEALVEGAYTFSAFRKLGAMGDGMHQLLTYARNAGARRCFTYVAADNLPSLRGCARAGFQLDHVLIDRRRFGRRSALRHAPQASDRERWELATRRTPT